MSKATPGTAADDAPLPDDVAVTVATGGGKGGDDRRYHFDADCWTLRFADGKRTLPTGQKPIRGQPCRSTDCKQAAPEGWEGYDE